MVRIRRRCNQCSLAPYFYLAVWRQKLVGNLQGFFVISTIKVVDIDPPARGIASVHRIFH